MTQEGWRQLAINAVRKIDDGDDTSIELLSQLLEEQDAAKQALRDKGYGCTGMGILETIEAQVPSACCIGKNMTDKEKILQWCHEESYGIGENNFVKKLRDGGLDDQQIIVVIEALDNTCRRCFDGDGGCQCWNDE